MIDPKNIPEFSRAQATFIIATFALITLSTFVSAPNLVVKVLSGVAFLCGVVAVVCVNYVFRKTKDQPDQESAPDTASWDDQPSRVLPAATKIEVLIIGALLSMIVLALLSMLIR